MLLTSRRPFQFTSGRMRDLEDAICEAPPRPPNLDRELDRIVLKALAQDPQRRYASSGDFADDLDR